MPLLLLLAAAQFEPIEMRSGFAVAGVTESGRNPAPRDPVVDEYIKTGRISLSGNVPWKAIEADKDGWFNDIAGGYVYVQANVDRARSAILEATGDSMVYINGEPRGGDPYAYGYVQTPVQLQKGINTFVFAGGRGRVKARLLPVFDSQQLNLADATMPDIIPSDTGKLFGAVVVVNNTNDDTTGLKIEAVLGSSKVSTSIPSIPPLTSRKVRFDFPVVRDKTEVALTLLDGKRVVGRGTVNVRNLKAGEQYKRTFVSQIDGSVQYYAVVPALKPSDKNSLVLSLHGASVEALGQAQAYVPKEDTTIVCPTNRRPYGFDWEDWGRMDAMEVFGLAQQEFKHDPTKVFLTGHSMGGHGTWSIGSLFPYQFGAIAPSAGWVSFWSYAGGWDPKDATIAEDAIRSAMTPSDTLLRGKNLGNEAIYILHGDKDDNVPVEEARAMKAYLDPWHPPAGYHEEPGAGHWWGNQCVDYPEIFATFEKNPRNPNPESFEFITPNPGISSSFAWLTINQLLDYSRPASARFALGKLMLDNVRDFAISKPFDHLEVNGQTLDAKRAGSYRWENDKFGPVKPVSTQKSPSSTGPFKLGFQRNMVFVYGTNGSREQNAWAYNKARFDAETWYYRGNGAVDVIADNNLGSTRDRNVVLYGNRSTNLAFDKLVPSLANEATPAGDEAALTVYRKKDNDGLVAIQWSQTMIGARVLDRLPVFTSGVAYPDWTVFGADVAQTGTKGIVRAGWFDSNWMIAPALRSH